MEDCVPFDAGGQHRLLAYGGVDQQISVRQLGGGAVKTAQGKRGVEQRLLQAALDDERRVRRQWSRNEGAHLLASIPANPVATGFTALHRSYALRSAPKIQRVKLNSQRHN